MPFFVAIYDFSHFTMPSGLSASDIEDDTTPNDWLNETITYNGGASTLLAINDDDGNFEDAYVETGGAQTLASDVVINGVPFTAGSVVENEFSLLDSDGNEVWIVRIAGVNVGFSYPSGNAPPTNFVGVTGRDGDPGDSDDGVGTIEPYQDLICFTPGTMIATPDGPVAVEALRVGDAVLTLDAGPQPVRWLSCRRVALRDTAHRDAAPIQIRAGTLGHGVPAADMVVSPQHRFVFHRAGRVRPAGVFVPAKALTVLPGVRVMKGKRRVDYTHFALDRHHVVWANGAQSESCHLGIDMLRLLSKPTRDEVMRLFPQVRDDPFDGFGPTARPVLRVQAARQMLRNSELVHRGKPTAIAARARLGEQAA